MYYQVLIETNEKIGKNGTNKKIYQIDGTSEERIINDIIIPFMKDIEFCVDGFFLKRENICRLKISTTEKSAQELSKYETDKNLARNIIYHVSRQSILEYDAYNTDITNLLIEKAGKIINSQQVKTIENKGISNKHKVFIVHGHDSEAKISIARFIEKLGFEAVILHEQVNKGMTIIEKIEENSNVGFCVVLYTPCDIGYDKNNESKKQNRARQNVVFEHGYMIAKLGRNNVCAIVKGEIEKPNDISGLVYIQMDANDGWQIGLAKEMKSAGYNINFNLIMQK